MDIEIMPREPASAKLHRIAQSMMQLAVEAQSLEARGNDVEVFGDIEHSNLRSDSQSNVYYIRVASTLRMRIAIWN